ncbi:uncharacterized protein N7473_000065 [Penicillium subrubescens]|uniref:Uncharacterized protein n=1 Tax=Penicillium subrubescens TaxID=1316194 RepID=A0A1Q5UKH3_9EURO|nr:uncharacterized protein N7473_000065 [Penicillium subrubescens]KAJ5910762.1 hypothetical protein N7473_000065 [Penicillium subrubescens]OKP12970.1 hypothetical protein PENSUB_1352 [Penicillium subrubescens]
MPKLIFSGLFLALGLSVAAPAPAPVPGTDGVAANTKYLITFGDSYTATGFNIDGTYPSLANPLGNPAFPGQTTDGGENWIGFLVSQYNTSLTLSFNFAVAGATTNHTIVAPANPSIPDLGQQVSLFWNSIAFNRASVPWDSQNTLAGIWMGINDLGGIYGQPNLDELLAEIMSSYFAQLSILYIAGLRRFILLAVPPMQRTPVFIDRGSEAISQEAAAISKYNSLLLAHLDDFKSSHTDASFKFLDTQQPFNQGLNNPTAYGAPDATCVNWDGLSCLWRDPYHPGVALQNLNAQYVRDQLSGWF